MLVEKAVRSTEVDDLCVLEPMQAKRERRSSIFKGCLQASQIAVQMAKKKWLRLTCPEYRMYCTCTWLFA